MICESCGERPATTLIRQVADGRLTQLHLCDVCAHRFGAASLFGLNGPFSSLLEGLMDAPSPREPEEKCPVCGATFQDIARSGKVGCARCYQVFRKQLASTVRSLHGTAVHRGKKPSSSGLRVVPNARQIVPLENPLLEEKKRLLRQAVEEQNYELAAVLRDEIREMERHG